MTTFTIQAFWDDEARVWVAQSSQVPGLCTEAATLELLSEKIQGMIPELLDDIPANSRVHLEALFDGS
jgi:predicted RNase H-like HicB family nuclease